MNYQIDQELEQIEEERTPCCSPEGCGLATPETRKYSIEDSCRDKGQQMCYLPVQEKQERKEDGHPTTPKGNSYNEALLIPLEVGFYVNEDNDQPEDEYADTGWFPEW